MDDLLLFTQRKKLHMSKLEDFLKVLLKNVFQISPKKCQLLARNYNIGGKPFYQR